MTGKISEPSELLAHLISRVARTVEIIMKRDCMARSAPGQILDGGYHIKVINIASGKQIKKQSTRRRPCPNVKATGLACGFGPMKRSGKNFVGSG